MEEAVARITPSLVAEAEEGEETCSKDKEVPAPIASFARSSVMSQPSVAIDAKDVEFPIILNETVGIDIRRRKMKQTSYKKEKETKCSTLV